MKNKSTSPIFIHSLFRAGSTYLFNTFRRSSYNYYCYQEPLHEYLLHAKSDLQKLIEVEKDTIEQLNHPSLDKPYFYEFYLVSDVVVANFCKEFSFDQYFFQEKLDSHKCGHYLKELSNAAKGRPVFQFCRSAGRVKQIKYECEGLHIFLWRNPWDQWWSYKVDTYFDLANLLIVNSSNCPKLFITLKEQLGLDSFHSDNIEEELNFFSKRMLTAEGSYTLFYALWCHSYLEAKPLCDLDINIDQLAISGSYRAAIVKELAEIGIVELDLSDCRLPNVVYGEKEMDFFVLEFLDQLKITNVCVENTNE